MDAASTSRLAGAVLAGLLSAPSPAIEIEPGEQVWPRIVGVFPGEQARSIVCELDLCLFVEYGLGSEGLRRIWRGEPEPSAPSLEGWLAAAQGAALLGASPGTNWIELDSPEPFQVALESCAVNGDSIELRHRLDHAEGTIHVSERLECLSAAEKRAFLDLVMGPETPGDGRDGMTLFRRKLRVDPPNACLSVHWMRKTQSVVWVWGGSDASRGRAVEPEGHASSVTTFGARSLTFTTLDTL